MKQGPKITLATSIAPAQIARQQAAINTWLEDGFNVIAVNNADEIRRLRDQFPGIAFAPVERDAAVSEGKPLVYFDDVLGVLRESGSAIVGIVNSDIYLVRSAVLAEQIGREAVGAFVYGKRVDVKSEKELVGETYALGSDYFVFDRSMIPEYPASTFCIGSPWWDYWAGFVPAVRGRRLKRVDTAVAYHPVHATQWTDEAWQSHFARFYDGLNQKELAELVPASLRRVLGICLSRRDRISFSECVAQYIDAQAQPVTLNPGGEPIRLRSIQSEIMDGIEISRRQGKRAVARKAAELAVREYGWIPEYHLILADILEEEGRPAERRAVLAALLDRLPCNRPALRRLARLCLAQGEVKEAISYAWRAVELDPEDSESQVLLDAARKRFSRRSVSDEPRKRPTSPAPGTGANDADLGRRTELTPGNRMEPGARRPLVSVLVSVYNCERFIRGCLEDLEKQTIADRLQILVVNTGSTENEDAIIREFQARYPNIESIRTEKRETIYSAWNRGLAAARGEYVTNANADDRHRADALEIMAAELDRRKVGIVYGDTLVTRFENETFENNRAHLAWVQPDFCVRQMLVYCPFGPQPMWRRDAHATVGRFDAQLTIAGDYELFLRIGWKFGGCHLPQPLGLYYENLDSLSYANQATVDSEVRSFLGRYRREIPIETIYGLPSDGRRITPKVKAAAMCHFANSLWFESPPEHLNLADVEFWYRKATSEEPDHFPSLNNLAVLLVAKLKRGEEGMRLLEGIADRFECARANLELARRAGPGTALDPDQLQIAQVSWSEKLSNLPPIAPLRERRMDLGDYFRTARKQGRTDERASVGEVREAVPLVTAIVSTYNSERFIRGCLEDLEAQTIAPQMEIVVVNTGSPQGEDRIVREFQQRHSNIRSIQTERRENMYWAWNRGVAAARGRFVTNANTDDRHRPDALAIMARELENRGVGIVYGDSLVSWRENETFERNTASEVWAQPDFSIRQMLMYCPFGPQPMWRRDAHLAVGGCNLEYEITGDYDLFIRLGWKHGGGHVRDSLGLYLESPKSHSNRNEEQGKDEAFRFVDSYRLTIPIEDIYEIPPDQRPLSPPNIARILCHYATTLLREGPLRDGAVVERLYRRALESEPGDVATLNNLAVLLFTKLERKKEAIRLMTGIGDHLACAGPNLDRMRAAMRPDGEKAPDFDLACVALPDLVRGPPPLVPIEKTRRPLADYRRTAPTPAPAQRIRRLRNDPAGEPVSSPPTGPRRPEASIIIPVHNAKEYLQRCLEALQANTPAELYEAILADDGSDEATVRFIRQLGGEYRLHRNESCCGFVCAANQGAVLARGNHLVFLNSDTEPQPGWLQAGLRPFEEDAEVGIVGAKLLYPDGTVQQAGFAVAATGDSTFGSDFLPRFQRIRGDDPRVNRRERVPAVSSACLFIKRSTFVKLGQFNQAYVMYYEDLDLCLKAMNKGFKVVYEPRSVVIHHEARSAATRSDTADRKHRARCGFHLTWRTWPRGSGDEAERAARERGTDGVEVLWTGMLLSSSGYSVAMRSHVLNLDAAGVKVAVNLLSNNPEFVRLMDGASFKVWKRLHERQVRDDILVCSTIAATRKGKDFFQSVWRENPGFGCYVGYTMFETDRIPESWVKACTWMDEVWVPSRFNVETFSRSGVPREKLKIVPLGIDGQRFDPAKVEPLEDRTDGRFTFLSVFEWSARKGWDVLLKAYLEAFSAHDDVALVLHPWCDMGAPPSRRVEEFLKLHKRKPGDGPRITVLERFLCDSEQPRLFKMADAYVMPSRGEGWGLPYMEAMAMGLPTIGTRWSANLDFMNDSNSYLIDCQEVPIPDHCLGEQPLHRELYGGHGWAEPSVEHTARLMRHVYEHREEARQKGQIARQQVLENFSGGKVAQIVIQNLKRIGASEPFRSRKDKNQKVMA